MSRLPRKLNKFSLDTKFKDKEYIWYDEILQY